MGGDDGDGLPPRHISPKIQNVMNTLHLIDPVKDFGKDLYAIKKPARYLGGELGSHPSIQSTDERLKLALCFPDLYEIGMSNNAIRILYNDLGGLSGEIVCERVFAPAPDFEELLRRRNIPLYTLESGIPLHECDILGFSVGYELLATNILAILDTGHIPILARDRTENDPIVIAGGPAITNPHPFGRFLDAAYIGEAEAEFYLLARQIAGLKRAGAFRADILSFLRSSPSLWIPGAPCGQGKAARRAVFAGFPTSSAFTAYPVPVLPTIQNHGTVEIMRGCPNGCRFCHAGYFYRPQRVKSVDRIENEVKALVEKGGYREITLASLSSGDYPDIVGLFRRLNAKWKARHVSFQLPSLKVDSFTLPLLAELSEVRKSGLTFAVETPVESWQASINKTVSFEKIASILKEAKQYGFRSAKFYFMIGLPVPERGRGEADAIIDFLQRIARIERIALNVNIGTFVPKPHTPYQREGQIGEKEALDAIYRIKDALRPYKFISIAYHSPFTSVIEGILSRGDERVGDIIQSAYARGARLDAWEEYFSKELWQKVFTETREAMRYDPEEEFLGPKPAPQALPWDDINLFVSKSFFEKENEKSLASEMTNSCADECDHRCGSCNDSFGIVSNIIQQKVLWASDSENLNENPLKMSEIAPPFRRGNASGTSLEDIRLVFAFKKVGKAAFYPLHSIPDVFSRAFNILDLPVRFTEGFNPLPKMEFMQPLALGIESVAEIGAVWLAAAIEVPGKAAFIEAFNAALPQGIEIVDFRTGSLRKEGKKSIGSLYRGSKYAIVPENPEAFVTLQQFFEKSDTLSGRILDGILTPESLRDSGLVAAGPLYSAFAVRLDDASGGENNIMKILSRAFPGGDILPNVRVLRIESFSHEDEGRLPLFNAL